MRIEVISLKRSVDRRIAFEAANGHLNYAFSDAVDGSRLPPSMVADAALFAPGLNYAPGAFGAALSHLRLWQAAAARDEETTVAEDDAVFRGDFAEASAELLARLPADWDIVLWGWNFDSVLSVRDMEEISPVVMAFDQDALRHSVADFQTLETRPKVLKLGMCFGLPAYSISPGGARKFIVGCFPLEDFELRLPLFDFALRNRGIDIAMSRFYGSANAFVAFPPLVVTPNRHETSTIQA
jgi:GR25 family glycosyltransferase involved in LPS biosynthesis